jgi:hypothetical protein
MLQTLAHESARKQGGETCLANGLSDSRIVFRVTIVADGVSPGAARRALLMSSLDNGDPVNMVRPEWLSRLLGLRTRVVAVWPCLSTS